MTNLNPDFEALPLNVGALREQFIANHVRLANEAHNMLWNLGPEIEGAKILTIDAYPSYLTLRHFAAAMCTVLVKSQHYEFFDHSYDLWEKIGGSATGAVLKSTICSAWQDKSAWDVFHLRPFCDYALKADERRQKIADWDFLALEVMSALTTQYIRCENLCLDNSQDDKEEREKKNSVLLCLVALGGRGL